MKEEQHRKAIGKMTKRIMDSKPGISAEEARKEAQKVADRIEAQGK